MLALAPRRVLKAEECGHEMERAPREAAAHEAQGGPSASHMSVFAN